LNKMRGQNKKKGGKGEKWRTRAYPSGEKTQRGGEDGEGKKIQLQKVTVGVVKVQGTSVIRKSN